MNGRLVPCPGCSRHVRSGEASCPFCFADLAGQESSAGLAAPMHGLARASRFRPAALAAKALAGAALGSSLLAIGCGSENALPPYGASCAECPIEDSGGTYILADAQIIDTPDAEPANDASVPADAHPDGPQDSGSDGETSDGPGFDGPAADAPVDAPPSDAHKHDAHGHDHDSGSDD